MISGATPCKPSSVGRPVNATGTEFEAVQLELTLANDRAPEIEAAEPDRSMAVMVMGLVEDRTARLNEGQAPCPRSRRRCPGPGWIPSPPYRLTLEQYERMVDEGIIERADRVHLINGILVAKMTQNAPHCTADDLCGAALPAAHPARLVHPRGQADPAPRPGQQARARSLRRAGDDPRLRASARPGRPTSPWSSRSPIPAWRRIASWPPRSTGPRESPSTGSSTWSIARSRSTPTRARKAIEIARGLSARGSPSPS